MTKPIEFARAREPARARTDDHNSFRWLQRQAGIVLTPGAAGGPLSW